MSYILDALNRAEAERERGGVPGLHARQTYVQTSQVTNSHRRIWIRLAILTLAGVAAGAWFWRMPADLPHPAVVAPPISTAPTPIAAQKEATPEVISATIPNAPAKTPKPPPIPVVEKSNAQPEAAPKPTPVDKEIVTASVPAGVPLLSELPSSLRGQIPPLNITGAVYSKNPGQRLLLVNNQVLNQGSLAAPEVTLEEIKANSSVFGFRGTRFRLEH